MLELQEQQRLISQQLELTLISLEQQPA